MIRLLLVLGLIAQARTCFAQADAAADRTPGMWGEVRCVHNLPVVEPPLPSLTGLPRAENIRHEAVHASQFSIGCDSIAALWKREPYFRLALEAEAFCTGIKVWPDSMRRIRRGQHAALLSQLYGNEVGFEDIYEELDHYCR